MKTMLENNRLVLCPEGRIDSTNAPTMEAEMLAALKANPGAEVSIDAGELTYISSAGLRVFMKLLKQREGRLPVVNVSPEVYDILEVTGFTELFDVKKRLREISVEGCELIGSGAYGKVYRLDRETIAKIYAPTISLEFVEQERAISRKVFLMRVPTAISYDVVKCGDCYGVVYELLDARTMAQLIDQDPGCIPAIGKSSAELLRRLHQIVPGEDSGLPRRKDKLLEWVDTLTELITPAEADKLRGFIRSIPERDTFLHGDFNSKNIMARAISSKPDPEGPATTEYEFQLIDIGDAATGHPVFDIAMLMNVYINVPGDAGKGLTEERVRHLLGFDIPGARKLWGVMCGAYFGLSDPDEIEALTRRLSPYSLLIMSFHATTISEDRAMLEARVNHLVRGRLLPAIDEAQPLDF